MGSTIPKPVVVVEVEEPRVRTYVCEDDGPYPVPGPEVDVNITVNPDVRPYYPNDQPYYPDSRPFIPDNQPFIEVETRPYEEPVIEICGDPDICPYPPRDDGRGFVEVDVRPFGYNEPAGAYLPYNDEPVVTIEERDYQPTITIEERDVRPFGGDDISPYPYNEPYTVDAYVDDDYVDDEPY